MLLVRQPYNRVNNIIQHLLPQQFVAKSLHSCYLPVNSTINITVIMPTTLSYNRSPQNSLPRAMTGKSPSKVPLAYPAPYKTTISPVHRGSSTYTSAVPSLVSDSGSTSSGRSSSGGASDVDLLDLLDIKLSHSVRSEPLDRGLARQAQTCVPFCVRPERCSGNHPANAITPEYSLTECLDPVS